MKLFAVKTKYGFNQHTFYEWLREQEIIEKSESGYKIGKRALSGMKESETIVLEGTEAITRTVVSIPNAKVEELVSRYENSGKDKLYSDKHYSDDLVDKVESLFRRVEILENRGNK